MTLAKASMGLASMIDVSWMDINSTRDGGSRLG